MTTSDPNPMVDQQSGDSGLFIRLVALDATSGSGDMAPSSYFRLGAYQPTDESALLPTATDPRPTVTGRSSPFDPHSTNSGILLYSDRNLMVDVVGAGFLKYGSGLGLAVAGGDAQIDVVDGQYHLSAQRGISITAGSASAAADILLTAYDQVIITSYGPTSSTSHGDTRQISYGDSYTEQRGASDTRTYGVASSYFYNQNRTYATDAELSLKLSTSLSIQGGAATTIALAANVNLSAGCLTVNSGAASTITIGPAYEAHLGQLIRAALGGHFGISPFTLETAEAKAEIAAQKLEDRLIDMSTAVLSTSSNQLKSAMDGLEIKMADLRSDLVALSVIC